MNTITQSEAGAAAGYAAASGNSKTERENQSSSVKKSKVTGARTIGEPQLSEKAKKYYDQLRRKYSNMDFILVSADMKEQAEANAGRYANKNRTVVLIDEDKIERMAEDEEYRKKYEGIISGAAKQLAQIKNSLGTDGGSVKTYGMKFDDGGNASFFAVIDKSLAAQKERIEKKAEQKAADRKKDKKAAEQQRLEDMRTKRAEDRKKTGRYGSYEDEDTVTVTASSADELLKKINDTIFSIRSEYIQSDAERQVGQNFDFAI